MKIQEVGIKGGMQKYHYIREIYGNLANFTLLNFHLCSNIVLKAEQKYAVYLELRSAEAVPHF